MTTPPIRLLHCMARTGGTIVSRCLGGMDGVVLLSEIHPVGWKLGAASAAGSSILSPAFQAHEWFGLISEDEASRFVGQGSVDSYLELMTLVHQRCRERGKTLIVRDWSHIDFTGVPFVEPSYRLTNAEILAQRFDVLGAACVRHPIDQWLSLSTRAVTHGRIDVETYLEGYRRFAELCAPIGFVRYEDFVRGPDAVLADLCARLEAPFDPGYRERWPGYTKISGDTEELDRLDTIAPQPRRPVEPGLIEQFADNPDYRRAINILGYKHPA